jgi:tricorn protease
MYREAWRIERDFLYDPGAHGLDLKAAERRYEPYLEHLASRSDLNYLFTEMLGELSLGHVFVVGGDRPEVKGAKAGLLGADYQIENGRFRFARVFGGENWNPKLRAPLTQPGARVKAGEYLLAVNGRELRAPENLYSYFDGTASKSVVLKVGPAADGKGAREVTVVPIDDEEPLRHRAWIEDNRRKVDRLSGGRVAYIYMPDTFEEGFTSFNRYFFAQSGKEAAVIDERFNGGGLLADHVIQYLNRPLMNYISTRDGADQTMPEGAIFGPKVMIVNELAGSGGDAMPYYFRQAKIGPLVGKRTWGGLVGIGGYPPLVDGGMVTAPHLAIWFPSGEWEVENRGVAPDIEVEFEPQAVRAGHDPQLEKAVAVVLEALEKQPRNTPKRPAYPNYHKSVRKY